MALSISSSGVTHTGQPGPCTRSISGGSNWSRPLLRMECVWPPHTSMIFQGRVTHWRISLSTARVSAPSRYSSMYFILISPVHHALAIAGEVRQLVGQHVHLAQYLERLLGLLLIQPANAKADVNDGVVADLNVGQVFKASFFHHTAKVHFAHLQAI